MQPDFLTLNRAQRLTIRKGPGLITVSALMVLGLAAIMGVMLALFPTAPPAATLAGPEAEARALAGQSEAARIVALVSGIAMLLLFRVRTATFDFAEKTLEIRDVRALVLVSRRCIALGDITAMRRHARLIGSYLGWVLRIHVRGERSVLLGPWAPDPGLALLIERVERANAVDALAVVKAHMAGEQVSDAAA